MRVTVGQVFTGNILRSAKDNWEQYLDFSLILGDDESLQPEFERLRAWIQTESALLNCWTWVPYFRARVIYMCVNVLLLVSFVYPACFVCDQMWMCVWRGLKEASCHTTIAFIGCVNVMRFYIGWSGR